MIEFANIGIDFHRARGLGVVGGRGIPAISSGAGGGGGAGSGRSGSCARSGRMNLAKSRPRFSEKQRSQFNRMG